MDKLPKFIQTENAGLIRDTNSKGLIANNKSEYDLYQQKLKRKLTDREEINSIKTQINSMTDDISSIKNALQELLNRK